MGIIETKEVLGGPFPSTKVVSNENGFPKGDKALTAEFMASMFASFINNGIVKGVAGELRVFVKSGLEIGVLNGAAWINGYMAKIDTPVYFELEPGSHYTVALRLESTKGLMSVIIYADDDDGILPRRNYSAYDLILGYVDLSDEDEDLEEIEASMLTDARADENLCGYAGTKI